MRTNVEKLAVEKDDRVVIRFTLEQCFGNNSSQSTEQVATAVDYEGLIELERQEF